MRSRVLSWFSIHCHTNIYLRKITMIDPQKGRWSGRCMEFKTIPCYKLKSKRLIVKSQNSKTNSLHQRKYVEGIHQHIKWIAQSGSSPSVSLKQVYHSHKMTLWMEEPVEAWKITGNNSKGFSLVNIPNQPVTIWCRESVRFAVRLPQVK